ncbi:MAG: glycine betaine ABC transporter substrate-binding protein [Candidatus Nanopelagicales bacterium]|nr:glycine betaine ABC transporter substrate-binding protein [Candidatus Nanopelagicales bacterium]MDZ4249726.1 glycine betaine ABC transporter substrate-binding protein [Candidatus Nanopelagicales bacterium]
MARAEARAGLSVSQRRRALLLAAVVSGALLASCASGSEDPQSPSPSQSESAPPVVSVAADPSNESRVLANLYAGALTASGQAAQVVPTDGFKSAVTAVEKGRIHVFGGPVGRLTDYLNGQASGSSPSPAASSNLDETMARARGLAGAQDLVVLDAAEASSGWAFAVSEKFAEANRFGTLGELAEYSRQSPVVLAAPANCRKRDYCLPGLQERYGLQVGRFVALDGRATLDALEEGSADVGLVRLSDGALTSLHLVVLADDMNLEIVGNIVPIVHESEAASTVRDTLNRVQSKLTQEAFAQMDYAVTYQGESPETVADAWLAVSGFA